MILLSWLMDIQDTYDCLVLKYVDSISTKPTTSAVGFFLHLIRSFQPKAKVRPHVVIGTYRLFY